jgi:hypothetical protein
LQFKDVESEEHSLEGTELPMSEGSRKRKEIGPASEPVGAASRLLGFLSAIYRARGVVSGGSTNSKCHSTVYIAILVTVQRPLAMWC